MPCTFTGVTMLFLHNHYIGTPFLITKAKATSNYKTQFRNLPFCTDQKWCLFSSLCGNVQVFPSQSSSPLPPCPPSLLYTPAKIIHLLACIPPSSAPGLDSISSQMLTNTASSISTPLSLVFNSSLTTKVVPSEWKGSLITPIPKTFPLPYMQKFSWVKYFVG